MTVVRALVVFALIALIAVILGGCPSFHAARPTDAPADATYAEIDGVYLRYQARGQGPAVVLIHGYGSSSEIWTKVMDRLASSHRVIAVDLKGFGYSSRPAGDYSPTAQAALVWKLLDKLGVETTDIVGHSWGTSVTLAMALANPGRVERIALYAAYVYEAQVPGFFRWARLGGFGELIFALNYRGRIEDRAYLAYFDPAFVTQARVEILERDLARPGTVAAALAAARGQRYAAVESLYRTVTAPTLLLWGRDDAVTPVAYGERLARDLPNASLKIYPRCGHVPMIEAATDSTRDLVSFLARDPQPSQPQPQPPEQELPVDDAGQGETR